MSRGRKPIMVDRVLFQNIITDLENRFGFANRSALWNAVAATGWAKSIKLSAQVAMMKAKGLGIIIKTPVGQKGRKPGQRPPIVSVEHRRRKRRIPLDVLQEVKNSFDPSLAKLVDRAAAGSMKAAVSLKCIDCSGGSKKEVALCTIKTCPLWGFRPYKRLKPETVTTEHNVPMEV